MNVRVTHTIDDLASDLAAIPVKGAAAFARTVRRNAVQGNRLARANARRTARKHGKLYPLAFSAEQRSPFVWEYGPDSAMPQGGMSFERGSRNQPPHFDLAKSADVQGPQLGKDIADDIDRLFW